MRTDSNSNDLFNNGKKILKTSFSPQKEPLNGIPMVIERGTDMFLKAVFPGKYIQGERVLGQLPRWVDLQAKTG